MWIVIIIVVWLTWMGLALHNAPELEDEPCPIIKEENELKNINPENQEDNK